MEFDKRVHNVRFTRIVLQHGNLITSVAGFQCTAIVCIFCAYKCSLTCLQCIDLNTLCEKSYFRYFLLTDETKPVVLSCVKEILTHYGLN